MNLFAQVKHAIYRHKVLRKCLNKHKRRVAEQGGRLIFGQYGGKPLSKMTSEIERIIDEDHPKFKRYRRAQKKFRRCQQSGDILDKAAVDNRMSSLFERIFGPQLLVHNRIYDCIRKTAVPSVHIRIPDKEAIKFHSASQECTMAICDSSFEKIRSIAKRTHKLLPDIQTATCYKSVHHPKHLCAHRNNSPNICPSNRHTNSPRQLKTIQSSNKELNPFKNNKRELSARKSTACCPNVSIPMQFQPLEQGKSLCPICKTSYPLDLALQTGGRNDNIKPLRHFQKLGSCSLCSRKCIAGKETMSEKCEQNLIIRSIVQLRNNLSNLGFKQPCNNDALPTHLWQKLLLPPIKTAKFITK